MLALQAPPSGSVKRNLEAGEIDQWGRVLDSKPNDLSSTLRISVVFLFCSRMLQKTVLCQTELKESSNSTMGIDLCSSHMSLPFASGGKQLQGTAQKASSKTIGSKEVGRV